MTESNFVIFCAVLGGPVNKKPKVDNKKRKGFDKELTDTSKKSLKEFRSR